MPNFVSLTPSIAELAHGENLVLNHSLSHSLTQSPSLFDAPGTEALALRKRQLLDAAALNVPRQFADLSF